MRYKIRASDIRAKRHRFYTTTGGGNSLITQNSKPQKKIRGKHKKEEREGKILPSAAPSSTPPPECYCIKDTHVSFMRDPLAANPSCASSGGGARAVTT